MKIGSNHDLPALDGLSVRGARTASSAAPVASAPATDQVDVSAAGAALARAGSDFDQAKVDAIRAAIAEGRFTVNAGAIADQLISDATALLSPRSVS